MVIIPYQATLCLALQRVHCRPYDNILINHLVELLSCEQAKVDVDEEGG